ncbi:MAG: aspartate aminotransferase family protein [Candidatus Aenigmatarchaeota archaeon]
MKRIRVKPRLPGPRTKKAVSGIERYGVKSTYEYPMSIRDGDGVYLQDLDGNWFLDFHANIASTAVGYRHPEIMDVLKKYSYLGAHKIAGQDFYTKEHADLLKKIVKITPADLTKVFLVNTGAEAVENAIKFAYRKRGPFPGVSCEGAFHGRTLGALTFTHSKAVQKKNYPELPHHIMKFYEEGKHACPEARCEEDFERIAEESGKPAFVLMELVQGEGGYRVAEKNFIRSLSKITRRAGVPLIFDEVQSGLGRTGKWWAFEHYGVRPDIMAMAKALQVGAVASAPRYAPKEPGAVSTTWGGGHRIDMAVALKTIEIIQKEKLVRNAAVQGPYLKNALEDLMDERGSIVDVRGLGLMVGVEFSSLKERDRVVLGCYKNGLNVFGVGRKSIRLCPPLIITREEIDLGLEILEKATS